MSSHDARKTIAGPSRSTTGVLPKNAVNRNAGSANIRGQSKSSTTIYNLCRERLERSLPRAASTNSVRFRRQPSNKTLSQSVSRSFVNDQVESGTLSTRERARSLSRLPIKGKESDRNVSLPLPRNGETNRNIARQLRGKESDKNVAKSASKVRQSDRNVARSASTIREIDRNLVRSASRITQSEWNIARSASKTRENERNIARSASKTKASERNNVKVVSKTRASDKNDTRAACQSRESERNVAQSASKIKGGDWNVARSASKTRDLTRSTSKTRESDRNIARSTSKSRESDRNVARSVSKSKDCNWNASGSLSKIRDSQRNLSKHLIKSKGTDRIMARPVNNTNRKEQTAGRPTKPHSEAYRGISKCEKSRDVSAHSLSKQKTSKQSIASPKRPASSASGTRGQPSSTCIADRAKAKSSALSVKSGGILSSRKLLSHLSLKKLSSFAFRKKTAAKHAASSQKESATKPKDKERPKSADSAVSLSRFEDPTQSSAQWTWSEETITKPASEYPGGVQVSQQRSGLEQARATICPDQATTVAPTSQDFKVGRPDQEVIRKPKSSAQLQTAYQKQDIFSLESFTECPEKLISKQECYCVPESTSGERESVSEETSSDGTKGEFCPRKGFSVPSEPKRDAASSPVFSIGKSRQDERKPCVAPKEIQTECRRPLQEVGSYVLLAKSQKDSVVQQTASRDCLDSLRKEGTSVLTLPKASLEHVSKMPVKKTESILKRTSSQLDHPCVSSVSFQKRETTSKKDPVLHEQCSVDSEPSDDIDHKSRQDISSVPAFISECFSGEPQNKEDSRARKSLSETLVKPRHEEVPIHSRSKAEVLSLDQTGQKDDFCMPSTSEPERIPETEPVACPVEAASTERISSEVTTSSDTSTGVAQYQLLIAREGKDCSSEVTEVTLDAICSDNMSQESSRVANQRVSKPPPTELICYPEESSRTGDGGKLSPSASICDSDEDSRSKRTTSDVELKAEQQPTVCDVELKPEEPPSCQEQPTVSDSGPKPEKPSSCQGQLTISDTELRPEELPSCQEQPIVSNVELKPEEPPSCQEQPTVSDLKLKPEKPSSCQEQRTVSDVELKPEEPPCCQEQPTVSDLKLKPEKPSSCQEQRIVSDVELKPEEPPCCQEQPTVSDLKLKPEKPSSCQEQRTVSDVELKPEEPPCCQEQPTVSDLKLKPEEPSSCQEQPTISDVELKPKGPSSSHEQASPVCTKRDTATSDDAVWLLLGQMPQVDECKCGNPSRQSSDNINHRPAKSESLTGVRGKDECPKPAALKPKRTSKLPKRSSEKEKQATDKETPSKKETPDAKKPEEKSCKNGEPIKPSKPPDLGLISDELQAKTVKYIPRSAKEQKSSGEERRRTSPKESRSCMDKDSPGTDKPPCERTDVNRDICPPHRHSAAVSSESLLPTEQTETYSVEEGTAARCEPISRLKLKKHCKEPTQSDLRDIQEDIRIWKDLYAGCLERLRSLQQMNQAPVRPPGRPDRLPETGPSYDKPHLSTSINCQTSIDEIKGGMDEAVRVLESEYGQVESALRKHSAVLAELVSVLQNRMTAQPEATRAAEHAELGLGTMKDVKENIHYLKALITENETLTMQLAAERAKQQVLRQVQVTNDVVDESISATEDKLHRTNSLLKMQMKRLQYEISRLTEAQNIETKAGTILVNQAEADVENDREVLESLQESNERLHELLSSKRFVSGQRVFKRASRGSFLSEDPTGNSYCAFRREQLECRVVISDRVQRNLELSNDEIMYLENLGRRMCQNITETNEEIRKNEFTWLQLRKERDELTKDLYPDLDRLHLMQDVAKEKLDLESKLRKENMLFRHQLEEFQKDLLEVETELMSGVITRRTEATKNKVLELETLHENAMLHNAKLREDCNVKHLTISRHDSLASLSIDEEEFQRQISEKIQRMELRIQADMDRRLLRPKRYVLEAPGKAKVSFRGQRNVIRAPKNVAEWRRKREPPSGAAEPPKPPQPKDAQELRREILAKLAEEKERAKEQLLRYEAHQIRQTADTMAEPNARELNELLGRLGRFLNQTRAQEPSRARPAQGSTGNAATQSLHGGEFGETLMHLIVQLDQLQSALTGEDSRRRTVRPTVASGRHRELLDKLPDASERGSENSNPTRGSTNTTTNNHYSNPNNKTSGGNSNPSS